jgi:hypothetical protein
VVAEEEKVVDTVVEAEMAEVVKAAADTVAEVVKAEAVDTVAEAETAVVPVDLAEAKVEAVDTVVEAETAEVVKADTKRKSILILLLHPVPMSVSHLLLQKEHREKTNSKNGNLIF